MFSIVTDLCCFDVVSSDSLSLSLSHFFRPAGARPRRVWLCLWCHLLRCVVGMVLSPPFSLGLGGVVVAAFVSCLLLCRAVLAVAVSVRLSVHLSFGQSIRLPAVHVCHLVLICVRFAVFFFVLHVSLAVFSNLTVRLHVCVC